MFHGFFRLSGWRKVIALLGLAGSPLVGVLLAPAARFPEHVEVAVFLSAVGMFLFALVLLWPGLAQLREVALTSVAPSKSANDPEEMPPAAKDSDQSLQQAANHDSDHHQSQLHALRELVTADPQRAAQVLKCWITADA
ncbi:MAG: hypothetical protein V3S33_02955 [Gammaproteobacteria bacterium]